jgi:DNA helicase-2/ATP-dependent DNA helicase PcrA
MTAPMPPNPSNTPHITPEQWQTLLARLNNAQREAVTAGDGAVLVLAGPGSGKTRVLTHRIAHLVAHKQVNPAHIMAVTFTNKAAREMQERIAKLMGDKLTGLRIGTFHALCARILRIEYQATPFAQDYVIYDTDDQIKLIEQVMSSLNLDSRKYSPRAVLGAISNAKNELILPKQYDAGDYFTEIVKRVYPRYQRSLLENNAMDFDDLLVNTVLMLQGDDYVREKYQNRLKHILVDEFQDTNMVQYQLVKLFGAPQNNIFAVGDEDQSIYAFRGADYRNVLRLRQDYPDAQVVLLEENYRSTQIILDVARAVIDQNRNRTRKELFTQQGDGERITIRQCYDDKEEARYIMEEINRLREAGIPYTDVAVMYRTNAQSRAIESACIDNAVPYVLVGGVGFYKRREVRDLLAYLRVISNPNDTVAFARIINTPRRGIGTKSFASFQQWVANENMNYGIALNKLLEGEKTPLANAAQKRFTEFAHLWQRWRNINDDPETPLVALLDAIMIDVGYNFYITDISENDLEIDDRMGNIAELRGLLIQADDLGMALNEFLSEQALMTDVDNAQMDGEKITLMTLHAAKGLEFPAVFITGLEEGILPHMRATDEDQTSGTREALEEERRLFYVGITRAKTNLYLTYAFRRTRFGSSEVRSASSFLNDVPEDLIDPATSTHDTQGNNFQKMTSWDSMYGDAESEPPRNNISAEEARQGLARLRRDFEQFRASLDDDDDAPPSTNKRQDKSKQRPNRSARQKIVRFPGSIDTGETQFEPNQRVRHPLFGVGRVLDSVLAGGDEEVTIQFENPRYGKKTLLASLANLTIISEA